jgi:hypothetical protein
LEHETNHLPHSKMPKSYESLCSISFNKKGFFIFVYGRRDWDAFCVPFILCLLFSFHFNFFQVFPFFQISSLKMIACIHNGQWLEVCYKLLGMSTFGPLWQIICVWIPYDLGGSCNICKVLLCKTQWGTWTCSINSHQKPMPHFLTQYQVVHIHQEVWGGGRGG